VAAYFQIVQILVAVFLILLILAQTKGQTGLGGAFSSDSSIFRTRRGVEKTLFQFTIATAVLFLILSIASLLAYKS